MPVESATFISQLVPANPLTTDPIAQGDDHIRLLKSTLQSQFTNLGTTAVTATADHINGAAVAFSGSGSVVVPPNGSSLGGEIVLQGVSGSGAVSIYNATTATAQPAALEFTVNDAGNTTSVGSMQLSSTGLNVAGQLFATTTLSAPVVLQNGQPIFPVGGIIAWSGSIGSIPTGWHLCDGTNGTPNLGGSFIVGASVAGPAPGVTGGGTSATGTTTSDGAHTHTGATGSAGAFTVSTDTQGAHSHTGTTGTYTLTVADIPSHSHSIDLFTDVTNTGNLGQVTSKSGNVAIGTTTGAIGGGGGHAHGISTDGAHAHNVSGPNHTHSISSDGGHTHTVTVSTLPPYYALCWIMFTG